MPRGYDGASASPDFANGAVTGAFGYLFNCTLHPGTCTAADKSAIQQEMRNCPDYGGSCAQTAIANAQEAGMVSNPTRDILLFEGTTISVGAAGALYPFAAPAGQWVIQNGEIVYRVADFLLNPVEKTAETLIELKPPPAQLEDIPEIVNETEKWLESLARGFKPPPKN